MVADTNLMVINSLEDTLVAIKIMEDFDSVPPLLLMAVMKQTNDLYHFNSFLNNFKNFQQ